MQGQIYPKTKVGGYMQGCIYPKTINIGYMRPRIILYIRRKPTQTTEIWITFTYNLFR